MTAPAHRRSHPHRRRPIRGSPSRLVACGWRLRRSRRSRSAVRRRRRLETLAAEGPGPPIDVSNQDSDHGLRTMALALVAARMDDDEARTEVRDAIDAAINTERGKTGGHGKRNRVLGVGRNLASYVIAADLIGLRSFAPALDERFRTWLVSLLTKPPTAAFPELTLAALDDSDPGNWR